VYSLNAPVPPAVASLATGLSDALPGARARTRGTHTLVVKRLSDDRSQGPGYSQLEARAREALRGTPPCAARVADIGVFEEVPVGRAPVVYLAVESPELKQLHEQLCSVFEPVENLEGEEYVLHVTIARGGDRAAAHDLATRDIDPIEWTVDELVFWDAERSQAVSRVSLPA
jgi:2'-5' RNA ligase